MFSIIGWLLCLVVAFIGVFWGFATWLYARAWGSSEPTPYVIAVLSFLIGAWGVWATITNAPFHVEMG